MSRHEWALMLLLFSQKLAICMALQKTLGVNVVGLFSLSMTIKIGLSPPDKPSPTTRGGQVFAL